MESFCIFFFTPFLELNLLLENNSAWLFSSPILKCFCMLVFLSVIENIVVPPFDLPFCCFRPRASYFYSQLKRVEKSFIMPGHYKKIMPTQQPIRAGVLL